MKNLFRRFLAVFLCLTLMVPLATVGVWAEESSGATPTNECAATVTIQNGDTTEFATAREAWDFVNRNTDSTVTMTLNKDWVAENGSFGDSSLKGFSSNGSLEPLYRTRPLTLDLNGNTIDRGLTRGMAYGQVLRLNSDFEGGEVYLKGGTIQGGYSSNQGGGILIQGDNIKLTLTDVIVTGNRSNRSGGGIFCGQCTSTLTLAGETKITGNESARQGGGIYLDWRDTSHMTVNLAGNIKVKDNKAANKNFRDLVLRGSATLNDVSGLTGGAEIVINNTVNTSGIIVSTALEQPDPYVEYFTCSNAGHSIGVNGENQLVIRNTPPVEKVLAKVTADGKTTDYTNIDTAWTEANRNTGRDITMTLCADWTVTSPIAPSARRNHSTMTIDLGGHTISRSQSGQGAIFDITKTGSFVIENGSLTGGSSGAIWFRGDTTNLTLDGMKIYGNTAANGGALYGDGTGTLHIKDSTITGNKGGSDSHGTLEAGGIYLSGSNLKVSLSGQVMIENNESAFEEQNDLVLGYGTLLSDISGLSKDSKIRVSIYPDGGGAFTPMDTAAKDPGCFESGDALFQVKQETDGDKSQLVLSQTGHVHIWNFEVKDATITAECSGESISGQCTATDRKLTIEAENQDYDGTPKGATLSAKTLAGQTVDENAILYYVKGQERNPIHKPSNAGTYVAKYTFVYRETGYTVQKEYKVNPIQQTIAAPTAKTVTDSSVELNAIAGGYGETSYGYSTENRAESVSNWQTGTTFSTGLAPDTTYYFFARYAGDKNHKEAVSDGLKLKTGEAPHVHNWHFTGEGDTIRATCLNPGHTYSGDDTSVTILPPKDLEYDGQPKEATLNRYTLVGNKLESYVRRDLRYTVKGSTETLSGAPVEAGDYTAYFYFFTKTTTSVAKVDFTIRPKTVTVDPNGVTVKDKVYDSTTRAEVTVDQSKVTGKIPGHAEVTVNGIGTFENRNVGDSRKAGITLTLSGHDAGNYKLSNVTIDGKTAKISPYQLTVIGTTVDDKDYDGKTTATVHVGTVDKIFSGDTVTVKATGTFVSAEAGENKDVNVTYTLEGIDKDNYIAPKGETCKASIKPKAGQTVQYSSPVYASGGAKNGLKNLEMKKISEYEVVLEPTGDELVLGKSGETKWYVVKNDVSTGEKSIRIKGTVNLIILDEKKLETKGGVIVNEGEGILHVYGGTSKTGATARVFGTGELNSDVAQSHLYNAGIGGEKEKANGDITITNCKVAAKAFHDESEHPGRAAGIGGGGSNSNDGGDGKNITLNCCTVDAVGGADGAGIGGGRKHSGINIVINGGDVTAKGTGAASHEGAAGIGGGFNGGCNGIYINSCRSLSGKDTKVTAEGARAGAGIGGGGADDKKGGILATNIVINGGTVKATVNESTSNDTGGAGIGSGRFEELGDITIHGGTITANGGCDGGAGIGSGEKGSCSGKISILGGTVTVEGGRDGGAGIGGGEESASGDILISGSKTKVDATGGSGEGLGYSSGAGIGGGYHADGKNINIEGGADVEAYGGTYDGGAGIGGGEKGNGTYITIQGQGTVVYASGGANEGGAGIGGGAKGGQGTHIWIGNGATIKKAVGGYRGGAGIGGGSNGEAYSIIIATYATVEAEGGHRGGAGIGGGMNALGHGIWITNHSNVIAEAGSGEGYGGGGAGIGGGYGKDGYDITMVDATVNAKGSEYEGGAGIGGGEGGNGYNITIKNSNVTATGGDPDDDGGAGIGGGQGKQGYNIFILENSKVIAKGGYDAAGIGGGDRSEGYKIEVRSGSTVEAYGYNDGAGIGGGDDARGSDMVFENCTVTARGGEYSAGIGGGDDGSGENIVIRNSRISAHGGEKSDTSGIGCGDRRKGVTKDIRVYGCVVKAADSNPPETVIDTSDGRDIGSSINHLQFVEVTCN